MAVVGGLDEREVSSRSQMYLELTLVVFAENECRSGKSKKKTAMGLGSFLRKRA